MPTCFVAVGTRVADGWVASDLAQSLETVAATANARHGHLPPRVDRHVGLVLLPGLTPSALLQVVGIVGADPDLVAAVWFVPPTQERFSAARCIGRAREARNGLFVGLWPLDGTADGPAVVLALHMTVLRARTEVQRRAVRAIAQHGTVSAAAKALGSSHQALSGARARANAHLTSATVLALAPLIAAIPGAEPAPQTAAQPQPEAAG